MAPSPGILEQLGVPSPKKVFLFPCPSAEAKPRGDDLLTFQYWPQTLTDDYQSNWAEKGIPGGSHPLYQWVNGAGRAIQFEAIFTAELNTQGGQVLNRVNALGPSGRYTVNVSAALAKIRQWQMPAYQNDQRGRAGRVQAPRRLCLCFPGTGLGGKPDARDTILCIMRAAPVTYESWFPNGEPRVATVPLQFNEIVQLPAAGGASGNSGGSQVKFIGRDAFTEHAKNYVFKSSLSHPALQAGG